MNQDPKYARRLLKLAEFLEKLPPKRFDYEAWVGETWKGKQDLSCGTTACALGWAATMPSLRRCGLRLATDTAHGEGYVTLTGRPLMSGCSAAFHESLSAAQIVFGLTMEEAETLFLPDVELAPDATAKEVAEHIRRCVKEWTE